MVLTCAWQLRLNASKKSTQADLQPLWAALAKATAKDRLGIFQGKVANELIAIGAMFEKYTPNLYLLAEVTSLHWTMNNPDALDSGSLGNAFLFTDSDVEVEQGISRQIGLVQSGGRPLPWLINRFC